MDVTKEYNLADELFLSWGISQLPSLLPLMRPGPLGWAATTATARVTKNVFMATVVPLLLKMRVTTFAHSFTVFKGDKNIRNTCEIGQKRVMEDGRRRVMDADSVTLHQQRNC